MGHRWISCYIEVHTKFEPQVSLLKWIKLTSLGKLNNVLRFLWVAEFENFIRFSIRPRFESRDTDLTFEMKKIHFSEETKCRIKIGFFWSLSSEMSSNFTDGSAWDPKIHILEADKTDLTGNWTENQDRSSQNLITFWFWTQFRFQCPKFCSQMGKMELSLGKWNKV